MQAQQQKLDAVSNDLANVNTNGYKRLRTEFSDLLYERGGRPTTSDNAQFGTGSRLIQNGRTFEQGALRQTDDPLNVGIEGEGFIKVKLSDGRQALTRDGDLHIDSAGHMVTSFGGTVQPQITIPKGVGPSQISIGLDGTVAAGGQNIGKIELATVRSPTNLASVGGTNAFVTTPQSGNAIAAPTATKLKQSTLEASNADVGTSMTEMMEAQRAYQLTSKAISTADQMMEIANGVKR
jgi:flagellar basal-body rod protein FlgG